MDAGQVYRDSLTIKTKEFYIIYISHYMFTTQSQFSVHHHIFDPFHQNFFLLFTFLMSIIFHF